MSIRFAVLATLLWAIPAAASAEGTAAPEVVAPPVAAPPLPDWTVTVGAGAVVLPSYPGASSSHVLPLPFVDVRYKNLFFLSPVAGIGVNIITTSRLQAGVSVLPDFGRSASAADRLRGWGDVGAGAGLKVFGACFLGPVTLVADARRQLGAGNGTLVDAGFTRTFFLSRHLILVPTATLTWADARYFRTYFGVDGNQSAIAASYGRALPTYAAGAGFRDAALTTVAIVPLDDRWSLQGLLRVEALLGNAAESPLTQRRFQPTFGSFIAYRL